MPWPYSCYPNDPTEEPRLSPAELLRDYFKIVRELECAEAAVRDAERKLDTWRLALQHRAEYERWDSSAE